MNDDIDDENSTALPDGESVQIKSEADSSRETGEGGLYSEVFWANAVKATIRQTHPRVPQLTTQLECEYKFESGLLHVRTLRYKMTTRYGNWDRANIDLYLRALGDAEKISPDSLLQDGQWHAYNHVISAPYGPTAAGGLETRMYIRVQYDGTDNDVEPDEGYSPDVYPVSTPIIQSPASGALVPQPFPVTGSHGLFGGVIIASFFDNGTTYTIGSGTVKNDGSWEVSARLPPNHLRVTVVVKQHNGSQMSRPSNSVVVSRYRAPRITYPANGAVLLLGTALEIKLKGEGTYDQIIDVYKPGGTIHYGSGTAGLNQAWEIDLNLDNYPSGGKFDMTAVHRNIGDWSDLHSFTLLGSPIISVPQSRDVIEANGPISGTGISGANVEVFKDLNPALRIGQAWVESDGSWKIVSVENAMSPGPYSIVARQTLSGVQGEFGAPRGFKVRPATFVGVNVEIIDTSIRFSGTAYPGATVEITGPEGTVPPPPVTADTGHWSTTATGWPYGTYTAQIIQKVGDGASGWIESLPFTFPVEKKLPNVRELQYTRDYQPTFSGLGNAGATVWLWEEKVDEAVAPHVPLTTDGPWSSRASEVWGPTFERRVRIKQAGFGQETDWVYLDVTIPPLAPGLNDPVEDGLKPRFSGTCWPDAEVMITFSDDSEMYEAAVVNDQWTFQRETEFAEEIEHTVTVTQKAAQLTSAPTSKPFTIERPMQAPLITFPEHDDAEVGSDVMIRGTGAMKGATLQLRDAQFDRDLGTPIRLLHDDAWAVRLDGLAFRKYSIDAQQNLNGRFSERSPLRHFQVVLLPPQINQPEPGGRVTRAAVLRGVGRAGGHVTVFLDGLEEPLLKDIPVVYDSRWFGRWEARVELPAGSQTLRALQTFKDADGTLHTSGKSEALTFDVVPLTPAIETPAPDAWIGRRTVVSGFGVPDDTITVTLGSATQTVVVASDRTWSVTVQHDLPDGAGVLRVTAQCRGLESDVVERALVVGGYQPIVEAPTAGRWVSDPVSFAGQGRNGEGQVVSWYDPQVKWTSPLVISEQRWRGEAEAPLPVGANWCRFRQTIDESGTTRLSDWVLTARFEVVDGSAETS